MRNTIHKVTQYYKKLLNQTINNQKGVVLPIILMAIGGLSLIGAAAVSVSSGEMNIAHNDRNYKLALNLAEAGINDAADGIAGNREILPVPLGAITNTSYTFNVGGTAFNNTGRYNVTVALPIFTTVKNVALLGANSVDVFDITQLNVGDSIVMGDATTHLMAKIGSITPGAGTEGTLNLVDGKNNPYIIGQQLDPGIRVAKNFIRVTSTGEAGSGLGSTYTAPALWRASSTINANPNITPPTAGPGAIRSTLTLQAEYTIQEINIIGSLRANVNATGANSKLNGPVLISDSGPPTNTLGSLDISPYAQNDYSGPIFMSTSAINANKLKINGNTYNPITGGVNGTYPKIIPISPTAAQKADVNKILNQAKASADCYQKACGPDATQQIYNINGYQLDVKVFKPQVSGGLSLNITEDSVEIDSNGNLVFIFVTTGNFTMSADNVTLPFTSTTTPPLPNTTNVLNPDSVSIIQKGSPTDTGTAVMTGAGGNIKMNGTFTAGTAIRVVIPPTEANKLGSGAYVWLYDNSNNAPGFGPNKSNSNGVFMTALGNIQSQQYQGDRAYLLDNAQGSHVHFNPVIQQTAPTIFARGIYGTDDKTLAPWSTAWTPVNGDGGAVLFNGRKASATNTWVVGDRAEYWVTYFIHTNGPNCVDHDIKIVSRTKVTYLGDSTKCSDADTRRILIYETIWNHLPKNSLNQGLQNDDNDPKLIQPIAHKGYFKWVGGKDIKDAEMIMGGKSILMGDKEFNSVFNHAADPKFHSAIVNLNISNLNMVAAANPPTVYSASKMTIDPVAFPITTAWIPANTKNWDITEMIGNRSAFTNGVLYTDYNGFDFTDFSIASGSVMTYNQNGNYVLPDASTTPGAAGNVGFDLYKSATPEITSVRTVGGVQMLVNGSNNWSGNGTASFPNNGTPIMNPSQLPTTTITATISGPWFSSFTVKRGAVNLFFDPANSIPFNIQTLTVETKGTGSNITMGSTANPVTIYAGTFKLKSEDCGGQTNFNYVGKIVASSVNFEGNVKYDVQSTMTNAPSCLSTTNNFIYLKKSNWKEIRN